MKKQGKSQRPRPGTILYEMLITLLVSIVVLTGAAHLIVFTGQQRRMMSQRLVATQEVGNLMEDFMTRSWDDVTSESLSQSPLSEGCLEKLPGAKLRVTVAPEADAGDTAKRISVQLDWAGPANRPVEPVRLVSWIYPDAEDRP